MKLLVISHNVFSLHSNMGRTLANFFTGIKPENIAQLYFHSEVPSVDTCKNYFRITDFDLIKKRKREIGTIFTKKDIHKNIKTTRVDSGIQTEIYNLGRKRKPYLYIGRNLLWAFNKWNNQNLWNWIDAFNPDVIFFASGDYVFAYKVAMAIAEKKNIPIVTYVCDDYYFLKRKSISPLYYMYRLQYKQTVRKLFAKHKNMVAICDKLGRDYEKEFGVSSQTVMTSSTLSPFPEKTDGECVLSYLGNLGYDRQIPLAEIGRAVKKISNGKLFVDVYSAETRPHILAELTEENGIRFHGSIPYDEVQFVMQKSDILIHTESMDTKNRDKVRYSVSTKIADSLACGRCLLAYGPSDVASIDYLKENACACVVTEKENLETIIQKLLSDKVFRNEFIKNGTKTAKENHDVIANSKKINQKLLQM